MLMKDMVLQYKNSILSLFLVIFLISAQLLPAQDPLTIAESSNFTATSRYDDVMDFIYRLQEKESQNIRLESLCISTEGRNIPLIILGKPAPASPSDLRNTKKTIIYLQANIHAGEVEGKEAALILARDLLFTDKSKFLDNLVILIAPIFNADGNDKISTDNRTNQLGPEQGVGVRFNGQNLDLNRDGMKLESPEMRGLVQNVLNRWDPALLVDCHTHNGSYHQEPVTYVWNLNPNGELSIIEYMRDQMIPWIKNNLLEEYNLHSTYHGDFVDAKYPETGWKPMGPEPRYLTNYIGIRNRMSILNENYPYVDYKTRVLGCYQFLFSIVEFCSNNSKEIMQLITSADQKTILRGQHPSDSDKFIVEYDLKPIKDKFTLQGYKMEVTEREGRRPQVKKMEEKVNYTLPFLADFVPKRSVQLPFGYLIKPVHRKVSENLLQHGLVVESLSAAVNLDVQAFIISKVTPSDRLNQGHYLNEIEGEYITEKKNFPVGTLFIKSAQPLANVAAYLLEPESDDGLLVWNFFDRYLVPQWGREAQIYPVYKLLKPVDLAKIRITSVK